MESDSNPASPDYFYLNLWHSRALAARLRVVELLKHAEVRRMEIHSYAPSPCLGTKAHNACPTFHNSNETPARYPAGGDTEGAWSSDCHRG